MGKPDLPDPDDIVYNFHIRDCDNRMRVVITDRTVANWHVCYQYLSDIDTTWKHYPGTTSGHGTRWEAEDMARQLYHQWRFQLIYRGRDVLKVEGLNKIVVEGVEGFRSQKIDAEKKRKEREASA